MPKNASPGFLGNPHKSEGNLMLNPLFAAHAESKIRAQHYDARLVSQNATVAPGGKSTFALAITPDKGWHIYWVNPGESGYAPDLKWRLPKGVTVGPVRHPVPESLVIVGFASNVHEGETILLQDMKFPVPLSSGTLVHLVVDIDLLVCSEASCIPDPVQLDIGLNVGAGTADPVNAALFARANAALPIASAAHSTLSSHDGTAKIFLPLVHIAPGEKAKIFGATPMVLSDSAVQRFDDTKDGTVITVKCGDQPSGSELPLLLRVDTANGKTRGYSFIAKAIDALPPAKGAIQDTSLSAFLLAFGGALLGGLILNLMPCVFPILSLKAMALAKAGGDDREARAEAVGYSVGAIGVILSLGAILLFLRGGGHALG
jgi:DsbC/DsbD-like thiol-disulfide interchange protein